MTTFIWNIQIEGNHKYSEEEIRKILKQQEVYVGQMKNHIHCDDISAYLRKNYTDVIWISASVEGISLKIQVKENTDRTFKRKSEVYEVPSDIVADKDGIITDIITRQGIPLVHIGDIVQRGDSLVSGNIPIYNDAKEIIDYQYVAADADIHAQTEVPYEEQLNSEHNVLKESGKKKWGIWLDTGKKRCYFGYSHPAGHAYYKILEKEKQISIGSQWNLPVSFGVLEYRECHLQTENYAETETRIILSENFHRFCKKLEEKGVQILQNSVKIYTGVERTTAKGILTLNEKIGNPVTVEKKLIPQAEEKTEE